MINSCYRLEGRCFISEDLYNLYFFFRNAKHLHQDKSYDEDIEIKS